MPFIEQDGPFFTGKRQQVQDQRRGRRVFQFDVGKNFRRGRKDDPPRALPIGENDRLPFCGDEGSVVGAGRVHSDVRYQIDLRLKHRRP